MKFLEAFARLNAFKQNLPKGRTEEKYVNEYHSILSLLAEDSGHTLEGFRVPESELSKRVTHTVSGGYGEESQTFYSDERYCDREVLMMKVDGLLSFFILQSPDKPQVGFQPPGSSR